VSRAHLTISLRAASRCGFVVALWLLCHSVSSAQYTDYGALAVQNRHYDATHELTLFGGLLPLDAFTKGATLGGAYTLHFSSMFAWEIVHVAHSFQYDTDLAEKLRREGNLEPVPFEILERVYTTALVLKPLYWKGALTATQVIHGEFFVTAGGGFGEWTRSQRPAAMLGGGFRLYLTELFSVRFDVRDHFFVFDEFELEQELWMALGCSLSL